MTRLCPGCGKRCYDSIGAAKRACRRMANRFRVYWCEGGGAWHVTHQESTY